MFLVHVILFYLALYGVFPFSEVLEHRSMSHIISTSDNGLSDNKVCPWNTSSSVSAE